MRVLVLATDLFSRGGIARYTSTLASSLGRMLGPENVDVLCFFDWGYDGNVPGDFGFRGAVSSEARAEVLSQAHFLLKAARAGISGYDLVIANHVALAPVAAMMKWAFGTPYWVACHSVEIWWGTSPWRHSALRRADLILPVSRYTAEVLRKRSGINASRVRVVYNAVPDRFSGLLTSRECVSSTVAEMGCGHRLLLSVCSMVKGNEFKGVDTVIRALPRILAAVPNARYVVVGDGEIRANLARLADEVGVRESLTFTGEVSDAELAEIYRACDVFVLPSRGQQRVGVVGGEGFGRVYVEAALAGKPVVGSRSGGATEAVLNGRTGFVVNPDSIDETAEAVLAILQDSQLAVSMGSNGRTWALETFSQDAVSVSLKDLLRPYGFVSESVPTLAHAGGQL